MGNINQVCDVHRGTLESVKAIVFRQSLGHGGL